MAQHTPGEPADAVAAATHCDPYPYYARLVRASPVSFDPVHRLWVVASAGAVTEVLTHQLCRVRPPTEPVPLHLAGTALESTYRCFARTNDGPAHAGYRAPVVAALDSLAT